MMFADWLDTGKYKIIAQQRDRDKNIVRSALQVVQNFITSRGRILYGGLSIDYALRIAGSKLYPDDELPDYDFYSPDNVRDAYELANILHTAGFPNVSAIHRLHVQTMAVRVNFITVADISYVPPVIFSSIPTLVHNGVRITHPHYQMMDMHLAFCFPYHSPPKEDVFHRFKKDLTRYNMLIAAYPFGAAKHGGKLLNIKPPNINDKHIELPGDVQYAYHGDAALSMYKQSMYELMKEYDVPFSATDISYKLEALEEGNKRVSSVSHNKLIVVTHEPRRLLDWVVKKYPDAKVTWYEPFMDIRPPMATVSGNDSRLELVIYSTVSSIGGKLLAISVLDSENTMVVNVQYVLLHYLFMHHTSRNDEDKQMYMELYKEAFGLLNIVMDLLVTSIVSYAKVKFKIEASGEQHDKMILEAIKIMNTSPFALSTKTMGTINENVPYLLSVMHTIMDINGAVRKISANSEGDNDVALVTSAKGTSTIRDPRVDILMDARIPKNYYPANASAQGTSGDRSFEIFQYDDSILYRRSGRETEAAQF